MITFSKSGIINSPIEKVFGIVSDPAQIPLWRNDVPKISEISGSPGVGMTFLEEVHFMGTKQLLMRVTEFALNKNITIQAEKGMSLLPTQHFTFVAEGDKTKLELNVSMKVSGFFKLMQFMLPGQLKKTWTKYFENLNELASAN